MKLRAALGLAAVVSSLAMLAGCSTDEVDTTNDAEDELIAGTDAVGAEFEAIGRLVSTFGGGSASTCTGTLIAPRVVLTAKHCMMKSAGEEGSPTHVQTGRVTFRIGRNANQPTQAARAIEATPSLLYHGGYTSLGSDVGIYVLDRDIVGIPPLKVADLPPGPADVGTPYLAVGYGRQNAAGVSGTRKKGQVTLRAVTGAPAPLAFGTPEAYIAFIQANRPEPLTEPQKAALRQMYLNPMSDAYEVYAGNAPGDSQVCHGDSGGPLLKKDATGQWVIYGVASTTMAEANNLCQRGGMYAVFGASTRRVIADAMGDHCGVSDQGVLACGLTNEPTSCSVLGAPTETTTPFMACLGASCCAETAECFGDQGCAALSQCFNGCTTAGGDATAQATCRRTCYQANAGSYEKYLAFQTCGRLNCAATSEAEN